MENYIVRIYDRDPNDARSVTGVVESVEKQTCRPFHSMDSLETLLFELGVAPAAEIRPSLSVAK